MKIVIGVFAIAIAIAVAGCGGDDCCKAVDALGPDLTRAEVLAVPAVANRDVDVLFMVDDSSPLETQTRLKTAFSTFINVLSAGADGLPNVHLGVVTSDLGTSATSDAMPGPSIGVGPGACASFGKAGNLQTYGAAGVTGNFISDIKNTDGSRSTNYTGSLSGTFASIASAGSAGCGFEQPIEAVQRALDHNAANVGFLRPNANLAIVLFTDEDDCSMAHSSLLGNNDPGLGALQSFRCTQFGITCDQGGQTTDAMAQVGTKSNCHSNEHSAYLTHIADHVTFLKGLKADPRKVMVAGLIGDPMPFATELRAPTGGGPTAPALAHSCTYTTSEVADPGVRIAELAGQFQHNVVRSICGNLGPALGELATQINSLTGSPCLTATIAQPADCVVTDESLTGELTLVPPCPQTSGACWSLVADPTSCPAFQKLKLDVSRPSAPPADTVTHVRCK